MDTSVLLKGFVTGTLILILGMISLRHFGMILISGVVMVDF